MRICLVSWPRILWDRVLAVRSMFHLLKHRLVSNEINYSEIPCADWQWACPIIHRMQYIVLLWFILHHLLCSCCIIATQSREQRRHSEICVTMKYVCNEIWQVYSRTRIYSLNAPWIMVHIFYWRGGNSSAARVTGLPTEWEGTWEIFFPFSLS